MHVIMFIIRNKQSIVITSVIIRVYGIAAAIFTADVAVFALTRDPRIRRSFLIRLVVRV